jgi:hypothetical protein
MCTVADIDRGEPNSLDLFQAPRMMKPKILKSEDISLGDVGANLNSTRQVIRRNPSKRKDHGKGKYSSPSNRGEKPVNLLKKGGSLHITLGIASAL